MEHPPHDQETIASLEDQRQHLQSELDARKTATARNQLGQFATPTALARDILAHGLALGPQTTPIRFLDPAIGTGSFYSALQWLSPPRPVASACGVEIDPHYGLPAKALWSGLALEYRIADFTRLPPPQDPCQRANLLICNPPYVRHHHLDVAEKTRLRARARQAAGMELSGLAGLYAHFMALAHPWMAEGALAGWLIPSEFMDVNYGQALKDYLLREVTLLHIHRFDPNDVQFQDALVSSAVVWFRNTPPPPDHQIRLSYGGTLAAPARDKSLSSRDLAATPKWTRFPVQDTAPAHHGYRLSDLFSVRRGVATGGNAFFILPEAQVQTLGLPRRFLRPVLPSTKHIPGDEILADATGMPRLTRRLYLLDCDLPEAEIQRDHPLLWAYLQTGVDSVAQAYLCRHRKHWYAQEQRPVPPIVCTYLGRSDTGRPFRFLLNHSQAIATNTFLMLYPQPLLARHLAAHPAALRTVWEALNALQPDTLTGEGRVYGGGLHKLEPRELAHVPVDSVAARIGLAPRSSPARTPAPAATPTPPPTPTELAWT
jgi:hypothetical protein